MAEEEYKYNREALIEEIESVGLYKTREMLRQHCDVVERYLSLTCDKAGCHDRAETIYYQAERAMLTRAYNKTVGIKDSEQAADLYESILAIFLNHRERVKAGVKQWQLG